MGTILFHLLLLFWCASGEPDCAKIGTRKPFKITPDNEYGLWPGLTSDHDLKYGENLFGVEEAIKRIWKNQHPPDCSKAKYLLSGEWHAGFGSEHYYHTINLGLALESGMIDVLLLSRAYRFM